MPRDFQSNIFFFPGMGDTTMPVGPALEKKDEMKSIAACLEYLYGEAVRLDIRMSAHLIGAAAESLREQIRVMSERERERETESEN